MQPNLFFFAFFFTFPCMGGNSSCDKECEDEQQGLPNGRPFLLIINNKKGNTYDRGKPITGATR